MAIKLTNSRTMPRPGIYDLSELSPEAFISFILNAAEVGTLQSHISHQQTADALTEMTGFPVRVNPRKATVEDGDVMLIVSLNHRPDGRLSVTATDFRFFRAQYWEHAPTISERLLKVIKDSE